MKNALKFVGLSGLFGLGLLSFINSSTDNSAAVEQSYRESYERTDDYETERSLEDYGDYDCSDFSSQSDAQDFFESEGGPDEDYHNLDRDGDGYVCESL